MMTPQNKGVASGFAQIVTTIEIINTAYTLTQLPRKPTHMHTHTQTHTHTHTHTLTHSHNFLANQHESYTHRVNSVHE